MTLCELITNPITRLAEQEGKDLDEIAKEVCPKVKYGREKIIRVIKDFLGEEYLVNHAETLKYDVEKAHLAKKRIRSSIQDQKTHQKSNATTDNDSPKSQQGKSAKHENKGACSQQCDKGEPDKQGNEQESDNQWSRHEPDKCDKSAAACREPTHDFDELIKEIKSLVSMYSLEDVRRALAVVAEVK